MPKFFNTTRGPVSATIGSSVVMFPAKQWTVVADDLGVSASVQSLIVQKILIVAPDVSALKAATSSKPSKAARAAAEAEKAAQAAKPAAKPEPVKAAPKMDAAKAESVKADPPKDAPAPKSETPEPAPAPMKS